MNIGSTTTITISLPLCTARRISRTALAVAGNSNSGSHLLVLLLESLELLLLINRVRRDLSRVRLRCLIARRALTKVLRRMLAQLLLWRVVLLITIVIQLVMITFKATLTTLTVHTLSPCTTVDYTGWVWLMVRLEAWVEEFGILSRWLQLGHRCLVGCSSTTHVLHLLVIHREIFLVKVLDTWFVILGSNYFLDSTRKWSLCTPLCLCIDHLVMLCKLLRLRLITITSLMLLISLVISCDNILLWSCRLLV